MRVIVLTRPNEPHFVVGPFEEGDPDIETYLAMYQRSPIPGRSHAWTTTDEPGGEISVVCLFGGKREVRFVDEDATEHLEL